MDNRKYHYKGSGLDNIFIEDGFEIEQTERGEVIRVKNVEQLHAAIAQALLESDSRLTGLEARFLRRHFCWSQKLMGEMLGETVDTIKKREKNPKALSGPVNGMLKVVIFETIEQKFSGLDLARNQPVSKSEIAFCSQDKNWASCIAQ